MKALSLLALLVLPLFHSAQSGDFEAPDYDEIKEEIEDKDSEFYYPKLMERFREGDTTMSLEAKRHLYYGFRYQDAYSPYGRSDYQNELREIFNQDTLLEKDYKEIKSLTAKGLEENPFDMRMLNNRLYALDELGDTAGFNITLAQYYIIVDAILSSGDGLKKESAYYVIVVPHEYAILSVLGFEFGGQQSTMEHRYDYLKLAENEYGIEGMYFDVSPSFDHLSEMFKED